MGYLEQGARCCWCLRLLGHRGGRGGGGGQLCFAADDKTNDFTKSKTQAYGDPSEIILARLPAFTGEILTAWETSPKASHPVVPLKCFFLGMGMGKRGDHEQNYPLKISVYLMMQVND